MHWNWLIAYFFAGVFTENAVPHFVSGVMGRAFQSPFAKPSGEGLSSSTVNVVWGVANLVVAYVLGFRVGTFDWHNTVHVAVFLGALLLKGVFSARHFGKFHGGNAPMTA